MNNCYLDKKGKKIACIIPAFNEEGKIGAATRGFLTIKELDEVVVVNDGSTDGTLAEIVAAREHDQRADEAGRRGRRKPHEAPPLLPVEL